MNLKMRIGVNPEKIKGEKNVLKEHRVIIPVYIPTEKDEYYKEAGDVFKIALESIFSTINYSTTSVTVINNSSCERVKKIIEQYLEKDLIEKSVQYTENHGKVYSVVSEAKASYEPFITIADADVKFYSGWEQAVVEIFLDHPKAGVVSPLPLQNLCFHKNSSVFFDNYLAGKIKYSKVVSNEDCDKFLKGMGNTSLLDRNNRQYSWREKQYFLKGKKPVLIGAGHFVATYRREIFDLITEFPKMKFINGYEESFLDDKADKKGWYRLSTVNTYAYHMGNRVENEDENTTPATEERSENLFFRNVKNPKKSIYPHWLRDFFFRTLRKLKKL
ncbi:glycosyltransferase family 2 protein [Salinimicrobium sp. TH3]|uniref:glycosyltransferase family 2 protein n=1 Tax=Salinimicrobium sp. TH3 TaxID=2997342 RepID=UPI0022742B3D|nr:glycosyltransferase family 2 protein [Salinimicrobium sp. TH3]MCY2687857.1 glycosyltransferase family 2 protein [Salinimicrobium sp. TH3]